MLSPLVFTILPAASVRVWSLKPARLLDPSRLQCPSTVQDRSTLQIVERLAGAIKPNVRHRQLPAAFFAMITSALACASILRWRNVSTWPFVFAAVDDATDLGEQQNRDVEIVRDALDASRVVADALAQSTPALPFPARNRGLSSSS
ncbi:hypothetical protein QCE83_22875 [Caballeronia sp. LZ034LL]|nr:hypothetical protein [Caballeronia sp. LZ034LL]MDR5837064.1 hypothetical protein [Caballeronia sp. LZ034LL]